MFKFTLNWLQDHLIIANFNQEKFCNLLGNLGLEVESVVDLQKLYQDFVFAKVLDTKSHPDAQKLKICTVFDGQKELQIVCGAPNAHTGMITILAPIGAIIPTNQMKIKKSKIRGIESQGMLCSASELGLGEDSDGIVDFSDIDSKLIQPGQSILQFFGFDDSVFELGITPNRGDCLSVLGVARDLQGAGFGNIKKSDIKNDLQADFQSDFSLGVKSQNCQRFLLCEFQNTKKNLSTPDFIKQRLKKIGAKSINFWVDLANYLCFDIGTPMHVYDVDKLQNCRKIVVQELTQAQKLLDLKENELDLQPGDLIIGDENKKVFCLAGIMGGLDCSVDADSQRILLEIGHFAPEPLLKTTQRLILHTEASKRYCRGVDSEQIMISMHKFIHMAREFSSTKVSNIIEYDNRDKKTTEIEINWDFFYSLTGARNITQEKAEQILQNLVFKKTTENGFTVPSWRHDISNQEDLFEEIVRVFGIDNIAEKPYEIAKCLNQTKDRDLEKNLNLQQKIRQILSISMHEVITWSFTDSKKALFFVENEQDLETLRLQNPIVENLDVMRPNLLCNILEQVQENCNRGVSRFAVFESGAVFDSHLQENEIFVGVFSGQYQKDGTHEKGRDFDFFDAKLQVENVLRACGIDLLKIDYQKIEQKYPVYKNNKSTELYYKNKKLARVGQLNPNFINKYYGIKKEVFVFEIWPENLSDARYNLGNLLQERKTIPIDRDLAFVVGENQNSFEMLFFIQKLDNLIENVEIFDIFISENMKEKQQKSIAFKIHFHCLQDQTLTYEAISIVFNKIIMQCCEKFSAVLRDVDYVDK